jgi:hypothetical protein
MIIRGSIVYFQYFMMLYSIYMQYNLVEVIPNHFEYAMTQVLHTVASIERITQWRPDLIGNRADRPQAIDMNRFKLLIKASVFRDPRNIYPFVPLALINNLNLFMSIACGRSARLPIRSGLHWVIHVYGV